MKKWQAVLWIFFFVALVPGLFFGAGTYSRVKTWSSGHTLDASDLNAEFDNIITYSTPAGLDDASATEVAMRVTVDPYPAAAVSLATSLEEELQRIRKALNELPNDQKIIITTEKDYVRSFIDVDLPIYYLPIKTEIINDSETFNELIQEYVRKN